MQPVRDHIYETIQSETIYSIKALAQQYRMSEPAIKVQLNRLKAEGKKITVEDDCILLNENSILWWFAFPALFIAAMLLVWWIG